MFFEVRVLDSKGKIKKVIPEKELTQIHWTKFEADLSVSKMKRGRSRGKK
jgi:hypothetical protein|tara:strand:- start:258 stop:407 length:150 start_codon:yes stop_codon:yes gene_type:complete